MSPCTPCIWFNVQSLYGKRCISDQERTWSASLAVFRGVRKELVVYYSTGTERRELQFYQYSLPSGWKLFIFRIWTNEWNYVIKGDQRSEPAEWKDTSRNETIKATQAKNEHNETSETTWVDNTSKRQVTHQLQEAYFSTFGRSKKIHFKYL